MPVPPAQATSYESAFHEACEAMGAGAFCLTFDRGDAEGPFSETRGHRAIGVVYDPTQDRYVNYVPTELSRRYDAFVFEDRTSELQPLVLPTEQGELPDTWPTAQ
jgi:erythromycin esterase-like protein